MRIKTICPLCQYSRCIEEKKNYRYCMNSILLFYGKDREELEDETFRKYLFYNIEEINEYRCLCGHYAYSEDDTDSIEYNTLTALLIYREAFEKVSIYDMHEIKYLLSIINRYDKKYSLSRHIPKDFLLKQLNKDREYDWELGCYMQIKYARTLIREDIERIVEESIERYK